jgi:hypothetical protein
VADALHNPKGILRYVKVPNGHVKVVSLDIQMQFQFGCNLNSHLGNNKIHDLQLFLEFDPCKVKENDLF